MSFEVKSFSELTIDELYKILQIRSQIFVVEQNCVYQDIDGKDALALHVFKKENNQIIAYTRLFNAGDYFTEASIGRVVVKQSARKFGYGHQILDFSIQTIQEKFNTTTIKIGAQTYLQKFYEGHSFEQVGNEYIEDGIPHIYMIKK